MKSLGVSVIGLLLAVVPTNLWPDNVPEWVERLGWTLVHSVWQLLAVAIVAALIDRGLRRRSANARYIAGVIALGAVFALPCVTWLTVRVESRHALDDLASRGASAPGQVAAEADSPGADAPRLANGIDHSDEANDRGVGSSAIRNLPTTDLDSAIRDADASQKTEDPTQAAGMVGTESQPTGWQRLVASVRAVIEPRLSLLVAVWVVGVVVCSMRPVWGLWTQWRLRRVGLAPVPEGVQRTLNELARRMGLARIVRIAESTLVRVPMVVGYLRPMILLPASVLTGLAPSQLEALLAHELAHVRRHDWLVNALQVLAETLFFFHPAVWWLSKRIRNERELCCDDIALSLINDKAVFARTLLILEELRQTTPFTTALAATDGDLVQRVSRLMPTEGSNGQAPNRSTVGACVAVMLAVGAALMLAFGVLGRAPTNDSAAAKDSDLDEAFVAKLPDGTVVELLGVSTGEKDSKWWSADGTQLETPPLKGPLDFIEFDRVEGFGTPEDRRSVAVRIRSERPRGVSYETKIDGVQGVLGSGRTRDGFQEAITITEPVSKLKTATVRVGLGEGVLGPPQGINPAGQKLPVTSGEEFSPWYDAISVASVGEHNNQTFLQLARVDQRPSHPAGNSVEWSVIDIQGVSYRGGYGSPSRPPNVDVTFDVPLARVARFEYRLRPERQQWVTFENVSLKPGRTTKVKVHVAAEIRPRDAVMQQLRLSGQAALERGDYPVMVARYQTLSKFAEATYSDALWYGHAQHLAGRWNEARDAYQLAISIADRRLTELDQQTESIEEATDFETEARTSGPKRNWILERDREREQIQKEWPKLVLLAGQVELTQLGDAAAAVKTLSRGIRFVPEAESMERLLEDAQKVAGKQQSPPHPNWSEWMMPMATQRSMAQAYEKLGDVEAAARCWSRIQLSFLAYQVGMAFVDAGHLVEIVSRVPADKRQPFHEFVLKHPGRPSHKRIPFAYQAKLGEDKQNPFRVAAKLDAFEPAKLGPVHANMVKLPNGRWLMAYTGGDAFQTRIFLSTSNDGSTWDAPWEFAHNNIFPAHSPSLVVDDDGTIWMLCTSQRFDIERYSSGGFRLWLCSSRDGREWSPLRPIKASEGFQFQYQNTVQLTRDRRGMFWVFGGGQYASAKTPEGLRTLQQLRLPLPEKAWASELHATFDANNRCHLAFVLRNDTICRTSSLDMQNWTPLEKLAERREGSRVTAPQLLIDGDRIALTYETFNGYLRRGQFRGDEVTWSDPISIGLPLGGAVLARDGDRVLLPSGEVSAVAAPVLLEAKVSDLLSPVGPLESTRPQPAIARQSEWGPEHHGLRTRLTLVSNRTAVGQPIELKCELQNAGTVARTINQQHWNGYRGFTVIGPDGKECELIAMPFTGIVRDTEIKPGETRTLFELDIAPYFLIPTAGEHTLRLHGGPQSKVGDIVEGRTPVPPPNDVLVTLAPGELTRLQTLFLKLRTLAPSGWRSNLSGSSIVLNGDGESKNVPLSEALIVHLWFADTEFSEAAEKENAAKRSEPTPPIIRFGETDFGFGHLSVTPSVLRHWAKCVEQIRAAIPITKLQPNQRSEAKPPRAGENQLVSEQQLSEWVADLSRGKRRTDFADELEPRYRALRLFRESGAAASSAIPELTKLLLNEETAGETALEAATALASIGPKSTAALTQALKSRNAEVRSRAAYALGTLEAEAKSAVPQLLKLAENSEETESVRCHAIWALGMIGKEHELVVPMLVSFLKHPSDLLRGTAASAIGRFGRDAKQAVPVLEPLLKDNDRLVRHWAAQSLTQIKDPDAKRDAGRGSPDPGKAAPPVVPTERLAGLVVDHEGRAAKGVRVRILKVTESGTSESLDVTTDDNGWFELRLGPRRVPGAMIVASVADESRMAFHQVPWEHDSKQPAKEIRLELKDSMRVDVEVTNAAGQPVEAADVGIIAAYSKVAGLTTDAAGKCSIRLPANAPIETVYARKSQSGLDYRSYHASSRRGREPAKAPKLEQPVKLSLTGIRPLTVRVLETPSDKPISGLRLTPWYVQKPGETSDLHMESHSFGVTTDAEGVAKFDWLPDWDESNLLQIWPTSKEFEHQRGSYNYKTGDGTLTMRLGRLVPLTGRVTHADGSPAANLRIQANGAGYTFDGFRGEATTDADGRYKILAAPHQVYLLLVHDQKWTAEPRTGFGVFPNQPIEGLDFVLRPPTRIFGRVTVGPDKSPVAKQQIHVYQYGKDLHNLKDVTFPNPEDSHRWVQPIIVHAVASDQEGRFELLVGPGQFDIRGPTQNKVEKFEITDEASREFNFDAPRPETGELTGLVVTGDPPRPVPNAVMYGIYRNQLANGDLTAKTDVDGRFQTTRQRHRTVIHVTDEKKTLGGVVEIGPDDSTVTIPIQSLVTANARLIDETTREPLADRVIKYGVKVPIGDDKAPWQTAFGGSTTTDAQGRFKLSRLIVGQTFEIDVETEKDRSWRQVGKVRPVSDKPIELGDLALKPAYVAPKPEQRLTAQFRLDKLLPDRIAAAKVEARRESLRILIVFADPAEEITKQIYAALRERSDPKIARAVNDFQQMWMKVKSTAEIAAAAKEMSLEVAKFDKLPSPSLVILNEDGSWRDALPLTRTDDNTLDVKAVREFLSSHMLPEKDAEQMLADALARAKKEDKRVFLQETASWCAPCRRLSGFIDQHREIFDAHFVWLKLDRERHTHGAEVMQRIRTGQDRGIPWIVILDADTKPIGTSDVPDGENYGFPTEPAEIDHFLNLLKSSAPRLTDEQANTLRKSLTAKP